MVKVVGRSAVDAGLIPGRDGDGDGDGNREGQGGAKGEEEEREKEEKRERDFSPFLCEGQTH